MKQTTQYLNTDLELLAPFDLKPLAQAFSERGASAFNLQLQEDGAWHATIELNLHTSPEPNASELLDIIGTLDPESQRLWAACASREFDIGYECGDEPTLFSHALSASTIARMAALAISLRLTLYRHSL